MGLCSILALPVLEPPELFFLFQRLLGVVVFTPQRLVFLQFLVFLYPDVALLWDCCICRPSRPPLPMPLYYYHCNQLASFPLLCMPLCYVPWMYAAAWISMYPLFSSLVHWRLSWFHYPLLLHDSYEESSFSCERCCQDQLAKKFLVKLVTFWAEQSPGLI